VIIGGVACEYYPISNCGLLTYIAVDETKRRSGIGKKLVDEVLSVLNQQAIKGFLYSRILFFNSNINSYSEQIKMFSNLFRNKFR